MLQEKHMIQSSSQTKHDCKFHQVEKSSSADRKGSLISAEEKLNKAGYKITKQRQNILEVLIAAEKPLTVSEVYKLANKKSKLDRVSSYRVIEVLKQLGLIHTVGESGLVFCSHKNRVDDLHLFLLCERCHCVQELSEMTNITNQVEALISKQTTFKPGGQIQVLGVCGHCNPKK
jgi:Fur family transcriptional regulator, zinc uptake regulator